MRPLVLSLSLAFAIVLAVSGPALAQPRPEFNLGFKALADQIPDVVGEPVEDEHYGANGDSLQLTSKGLMVWRKADNWTAFTDGTRTWINGPEGIQDRPNNVRFVWETEGGTPSAPPAPQTYGVEVRAMDLESGGPGVTIRRLMSEVDSYGAQAWGWRPSRPTTLYLFIDGYHIGLGMPSILGRPISSSERREYETNTLAFLSEDAQTGGWAMVMRVNSGMGTPEWESITKGILVRQYFYLMQRETAGAAGSAWYVEGLARVHSNAAVPTDPALRGELAAVFDAKKKGTLPTLRKLQQDWAGYVSISTGYQATGNGMSYLAAQILSDRVGGGAALDILRRTGRGEDFESVVRGVAGYTLEQLDAQLKAGL